jgi:hypothetical protein
MDSDGRAISRNGKNVNAMAEATTESAKAVIDADVPRFPLPAIVLPAGMILRKISLTTRPTRGYWSLCAELRDPAGKAISTREVP